MPTVYPTAAQLALAAPIFDEFDLCVVRLWKAGQLNPIVDTTLAECTAAECNFSGYPADGLTVTALQAPFTTLEGGIQANTGLLQFTSTAANPFVENMVGGFYVVSSGGLLLLVGTLDTAVPIGGPNQAVPINVGQVFFRPAG